MNTVSESNELLLDIYNQLKTSGMTRKEIDEVGHLLVAPGETVRDYVDMLKDSGSIEWRCDRWIFILNLFHSVQMRDFANLKRGNEVIIRQGVPGFEQTTVTVVAEVHDNTFTTIEGIKIDACTAAGKVCTTGIHHDLSN